MTEQGKLDIQAEKKMDTVEEYQFEPIKGYPMLHWKGKRPFSSTQYYPAQLKEKLKLDAIPGQISTTEFDDDWTSNETALWGSTTRMMYNKFTTAEPGTFDTIDYVNFAQSSVR